MGITLADLRLRRGLSQEKLAAELGVERTTVQRWEAGNSTPRPKTMSELAKTLEVTVADLREVLGDQGDIGRLDSRFASYGDGDDRLAMLARASNLHSGQVEQLYWRISALAVDYVHEPVDRVLPDLLAARDTITDLLAGRQAPHHTRDLYVLAGTTCLLLAHAAQNQGDHRAALTRLATAADCATAADHDALHAWTRGSVALIHEWSLNPRMAVDIAARGAQHAASARSRIRLAAITARAAARTGDTGAAAQALRAIETIRDGADDRDDITDLGGLFDFPAAKVDYYLGSVHGLLGDHTRARVHAEAAITAYETGDPAARSYGDEALARVDLANAHLADHDHRAAADALGPVLALPPGLRIRQFGIALGRTRRMLAAATAPTETALRKRITTFVDPLTTALASTR
ncbi:Tetratricopeptide TPR_4 [Alloactinosynnema sp. L-07]|uniref:helix-turn-helix transcriptional regulator n=1 Tax=Alloactinosynnema sp. L-07 TaxID=1653480 RepID=UPI00065F0B19|nr:helix-turn-helix transcriptional regulator [Alloactinosynnema sp. L-07]CRK56896.1 Tetratricopeptide TPR_4 [Alloactinosynnema sp. L-07]